VPKPQRDVSKIGANRKASGSSGRSADVSPEVCYAE